MDEEVPVIKKVTHNPNKFKRMTPDELGEYISDIAEKSGLPKEIAFLMHTHGWIYISATDDAVGRWVPGD